MTEPKMHPWVPMSKPIDQKHLGKTIEEFGEAISALARCQIQGIDECHPVTGKSNRQWLQEELADVKASSDLLIGHFKLDIPAIDHRAESKRRELREWHQMLDESSTSASMRPPIRQAVPKQITLRMARTACSMWLISREPACVIALAVIVGTAEAQPHPETFKETGTALVCEELIYPQNINDELGNMILCAIERRVQAWGPVDDSTEFWQPIWDIAVDYLSKN